MIGSRKAAAAGAGGLWVAAVGLLGWQWGPVVGLLVVAGGLAAALLLAGAAYLRLRRELATVARHGREQRQQAVSQTAELARLRGAVAEGQTRAQVELTRLQHGQQRQLIRDRAQWAQSRRAATGEGFAVSRDEEIGLVRASGLVLDGWYERQVGQRVGDAASHYVDHGAESGVDPHPAFPTAGYLERRPDALVKWRTPVGHFQALRSAGTTLDLPLVRADGGRARDDDLKWEYLVRGLDQEPDTFVLYRIVGNDLPPRHRSGQGLENLRFILDHEADFAGCEKRFVVNRIVDPELEKRVLALLQERGVEFLHIPFEPDEYRTVGWRYREFGVPGFTFRREFDELTFTDQQRALDHLYHDKNLYVMNNNGARNAALAQGRGRAKWVLPWDGNSFLTPRAWEELTAAVTSRPYLKYFTVPMARVTDNTVLLWPDPAIEATEEPQVVFRRDAAETFDPDARYGRCPKVELFGRLGVPGPWDGWCRGRWDRKRAPLAAEAGQVGEAGWVARLFSGEQSLERDIKERGWRRMQAVRDQIDRVDVTVAAELFDPAALLSIDEETLSTQRERWRDGDPELREIVTRLTGAAEQAVDRRRPAPAAAVDAVMLPALAGYLTGQPRLLAGAVAALRRCLSSTRASAGQGPGANLYYLPDAVRLLDRADALSGKDHRRYREWLAGHRDRLTAGPGRAGRASLDLSGTWYDLTLTAIEAGLGDLPGLLAVQRQAAERAWQQFATPPPDGSPGPRVRNLWGWTMLAGASHSTGQDLWQERVGPDAGPRSTLADVVRGELVKLLADHARTAPVEADHVAALAHQVAPVNGFSAVLSCADGSCRNPFRVRQVFPDPVGVRPFWALGSRGANQSIGGSSAVPPRKEGIRGRSIGEPS